MRTLLKLFFLLLIACSVKAQTPPAPAGFPTLNSNGYYKIGWIQADSGNIPAYRDTNWIPKYQGTFILYQHAGVDTALWYRLGNKWVKILKQGDVPNLTATSPIVYLNGNISCPTCGTGGGGITSLNGLTATTQTFTIGSSGVDFNILSSGSAHAFNIPDGGPSARGLLTTALYNTFNTKQSQINGTGFVVATGTTISFDNTVYYPNSNPSSFISRIGISALSPILYNSSTGVVSADTTAGNTHLATQAYVLNHQASGTITGSGNLSPLFTTSIVSNTIVFTISNAAAGSILGNNTGSTGPPSYFVPNATTVSGWLTYTPVSSVLTSAHILVGNVSNVATDVSVSGDLSLTNTGAFTIVSNAVTTAKINNNAVTYAKFQASSGAALLGATGAANFQEITLGTGLSFTGTTLNAAVGGSTNSNIGSGFRWAVLSTNNIKTAFGSTFIAYDSTTNTNAITAKIANGTANNLLGWNGSGVPTSLAPDTLFIKKIGTGDSTVYISADTLYNYAIKDSANFHHYINASGGYTFYSTTTGGGTVTQFNFTNGGGINGAVTNATTTPTLALTPSFTGLVQANSGTSFSAVSIGTGLSFSGGTLSSTALIDPLTTNGDIIARISGSTTRLAQGGNGTFLGVSGGVLGYYTPSGASQTLQQVFNTGSIQTKNDTVFQTAFNTYFNAGRTIADDLEVTPITNAHIPDSMLNLGNSIATGIDASPLKEGYAYLTDSALRLPLGDYSQSTTGTYFQVKQHNLFVFPGHKSMSVCEASINDIIHQNWNTPVNARRTMNKIVNGYKSIFVNQFLKSYTQGGAFTVHGTFAALDMRTYGGKSPAGEWTNTAGDSANTTITGTSVVLQFIGSPSGTGGDIHNMATKVNIYIDGVATDSFNLQGQTDSINIAGHVDEYTPVAKIYTGLTNTAHAIRIVNTSGNRMYMDYAGTLVDTSTAKPLVILKCIYSTTNQYKVTYVTGRSSLTDTVNALLDSLNTAFPAGYSRLVFNTNGSFNVNSSDTSTGSPLHPSTLGHLHIFQGLFPAISAAFALYNVYPGGIGWLNGLYYGNNGSGRRPFATIDSVATLISAVGNLRTTGTNFAGFYPVYVTIGAVSTVSNGLLFQSGTTVQSNGAQFNATNINNTGPFTISGSGGLINFGKNNGTGQGWTISDDATRLQFLDFLNSNSLKLAIGHGTNPVIIDAGNLGYTMIGQNASKGGKFQVNGDSYFGDSVRFHIVRDASNTDSIAFIRKVAGGLDSGSVITKAAVGSGLTLSGGVLSATGGITTVGAFSGSSIANGASISTNTITFGPADATNPGMVTTGIQSFGGSKSFGSTRFNVTSDTTNLSGGIYFNQIFPSTGSNFVMSTTGYFFNLLTIGADRTFTFPTLSTLGGRTFEIVNSNGGAFKWSLTNSVVDAAGNSISTMPLVNGWTYKFTSDGAGQWYLMSSTGPNGIFESSSTSINIIGNSDYIFTGGSLATWTLPTLSGHTKARYYVKNAGSVTLTIAASGSDNLYDASSVASITLAPGSSKIIIGGTSFWYVE